MPCQATADYSIHTNSHPQILEQVSKSGRFLVVLISIMGGEHIIRFVVLSLIQLKTGERGH